jgi:hypothetical protein
MEEVKYELSEFKAAWQAKCPRCRIGHVYKGPAYGLKVQKMNSHCEYCGLRYEREPGYFLWCHVCNLCILYRRDG